MSHTLVFVAIIPEFCSFQEHSCENMPVEVSMSGLSELLTFTHLRRFSQKAFGKVSTQHSDRIYGYVKTEMSCDELVTLY